MQILNRHKIESWPPSSRYIGRGTPFGNPFAIGHDGDRAQVIAKYRDYLDRAINNGEKEVIQAMRGIRADTTLVCSCTPAPCHGQVIEELWQAYFSSERPLTYVFGSNQAGRHGKGSAEYAKQVFGAIPGQGEGPQGSAYAIPTKNSNLQTLSLDHVLDDVQRFLGHARKNPDTDFLVTRIGCGLAGYREEHISPLFALAPNNCLLPGGWRDTELANYDIRIMVCGSRNLQNKALVFDKLDQLLNRFSDENILVIAGGANGADTFAVNWAKDQGIDYREVPADWDDMTVPCAIPRKNGRGRAYNARAGYNRNVKMLSMASHIVGFWDGQSTGTRHSLEKGKQIGIPVWKVDTRIDQGKSSPSPG